MAHSNLPKAPLPPGATDAALDVIDEALPDITFTDLLPAHIAKKLQSAGIETLAQLKEKTQHELLQIPKMGKTSVEKIVKLAGDNGVVLLIGKPLKKAKKVVVKKPKKGLKDLKIINQPKLSQPHTTASSAAAAKKTKASTEIVVTVELDGPGMSIQLCQTVMKLKNGTLQGGVLKALEKAVKDASKLPG